LIAAFGNILPLVVSFFGLRIAAGLLSDKTGELPAVVRPLFEIFVLPTATKMLSVGAVALILLLTAALAAFILVKSKTPKKVK
jgi:hypothetical protein